MTPSGHAADSATRDALRQSFGEKVLTVYDEGRDTAAIGIEARRYVAAPCNSSESGIGSPWLQYGYRRIMARVFSAQCGSR
jgi:hypothetical protein